MVGRIRDEDIATVRERVKIDEVVSSYVTLRNAGGGSMKGLCPFHDEKSPSFHVTPSRGFFHCLAGETRVLTRDGPREIRDLAGGIHRILGARGDWIDAPFKSYGVQRLHRITVTRNRQRKELYATDGHRWFIRSGKAQQNAREVLTTDLKAGDRLVSKFPRSRIRRTTPSPFGIAHGFTYGDGTLNGTGSMALICPPKDEAMLKWFPNSHTSERGDGNLLVHHLPKFFKDRPSLDESVPYLYGWLAGYFAADGCVAADGTVIMNSADREDLEFFRTVCTRLGIATYGITSQTRLGLGTEPSELFRIHLVNEDLEEDFFLLDSHRRRFVDAHKAFARRGWVVESVEETDRVEEVFCAEVEDGHAFTLEDNILTGNCFGCQEGGDVFTFLMKIDGLSFGEAVERMADKYGVQLRRDETGQDDRPKGPQRRRLVEAHAVAQEFYAEQLGTPEALAARQFLAERGFDQGAALKFGVGFAPRDGEALWRHLSGRKFTREEVIAAGLVAMGRSLYDKFRGRLLWPIRETNGDTIGFGARRIFEDDRIEAKYLNTSETPIYKKSQVLYGIDLARKPIALSSKAVVVEGYTDVMACHLAGVETAVATCGTAFGDDHARVLRRFLDDHAELRSEVVFTFDGDEAGQKAALRTFEGDQRFVSQTYVAVAPEGMDPCELRISKGDDAVRELIASRRPLYRFVLENVVKRHDLDRADGRIDAVRDAAALVASVRDQSKVTAFAQEISRLVGADIDTNQVLAAVRRAAAKGPQQDRGMKSSRAAERPPEQPAPAPRVPDLRDPRFGIERETLKLVLQHPVAIGRTSADIGLNDFVHPTYRGVWEAITAAGGAVAGQNDAGWVAHVRDAATDPAVSSIVSALAVEPIPANRDIDAGYIATHLFRLQELTVLRRIDEVKSRLQRTNPLDNPTDYNKMFGELAALEQHRRTLREKIVGVP
ncbi:DNA primase [Nocardioides sp. QY071]|uniref:DNA primase n=1 Tax=Nocardioides sp. QY071 TaxID=3044187 RepID=UPI00249A5109|nr:DNA primase [Nocardioides sp. QY071]WGY03988.1 DNA primase [Nocardioides sp. QY071]